MTETVKTNFLLYTFRTFPLVEMLSPYDPFIFGKLTADLQQISDNIFKSSPKLILGIALNNGTSRPSRFESSTVNRFNRTKMINRKGKDFYPLDYPLNGYKTIAVSHLTDDSFCNWTMYKISELIEPLSIRQQFIHISKNAMNDLMSYLKSLR